MSVRPPADLDVNVLVLRKAGQSWSILYTDADRAAALRTLGRWAGNPELDFSWYDAAVLSQRIRRSTPIT